MTENDDEIKRKELEVLAARYEQRDELKKQIQILKLAKRLERK